MVPRWLEPDVLANASRFITFYGVSFLIFVGLWLYHKIYFYPKQSLIYEDNPEPLVTELFHAI
ncbi:MAG: hypothetical protein C0168_10285 [Candidatus Aminicenantes bacterium]|nr:MAG: hypothetical protein C0168_10285 [Candidatus Aminicenantes bacterium]